MEGGVQGGSPPPKPSKFTVYRNPALSAALAANSLQPSKSTFFAIVSFSIASSFLIAALFYWENGFIEDMKLRNFSQETAYWFAKICEILVSLVVLGSLGAVINAISFCKAKNIVGVPVTSLSNGTKDQVQLTNRQIGLLGIRPKVDPAPFDSSKKPPKSKPYSSSPSEPLVPLHQPINTPKRGPANVGNQIRSFGTPSKSPTSPSSLLSSIQTSPGMVSTPWSNHRGSSSKDITTEERFEKFLADVDEKLTESAGKAVSTPVSFNGFGIATPNTIASSTNTSGTTRSTPLRPVRMSPGSQKFSTPPKKGEGDLPPPMSMEESIEAFEQLGIYPQIEQWRDRLRQWFSAILLNPLLSKIENSHLQVMQAASKLGISVAINQIGSDVPPIGIPSSGSPIDRTKEWQLAFTPDEDGLLHQLRANLVQAIDSSTTKLPTMNLQQAPQPNPLIPAIQECVNAITEHQRLHALMKGELIKGLLPQSSVRADYTVQRIRELAEGTCLKNYEYLGNGEVYDKKNKKWTLELPTDSHLLLYLFCAFLEHPKWMLHADPTSYLGAQSSKNPLFAGVLPPKEMFPEKFIAVTSHVPSIHPGACILIVGRQSPPVFALYWDKKQRFSLQGRTALWDSILVLCHRIKVGYGGMVRGMHIGSSAFRLLPVLDSETQD